MAKKLEDDQKCVHDPNLIEDEEEQEEALSLCDLPTNDDQSRTEAAAARAIQSQDDFDFGSWSSSSLLTQPEMCAADDIFFQGQILPLRHSISSESVLAKFRQDSNKSNYGCISRSASMDHHCWGGGFSSRSSSIRSHNSASSGSTSTTTTLPPKGKGYRPKLRNQFHSHPSPTPQIRIPSNRHNNSSHHHPNPKSTMWRFFQVGLLRTPEMEFKNLKVRTRDNIFGSRNSNSSISTSSSISSTRNAENKKIENSKKMKLHSGLFGISCKCSVDAIETVPLNIVIVKNSSNNKNGSEKEELLGKGEKKKKKKMREKEENNQGKQAMSRHRTFEWLKQLSLQEGGGASSSRPDQV